jgi:nitroimidazol reductase NimA-like FMN-containing flavoprotein (pyridoxamine 5'-phosphate oxidase superfamily)
VLPTLFVRVGDEIALHGAPANAMLRSSARGEAICCTVTLVDALVLARSAFHHSVNYRSAVVFGRCREVTDADEKLALMTALVDKVVPGRASEAREPSLKELRATQVVVMAIEDASAKVRTGPPVDDEEDFELPVWAGELPITAAPGQPVPDARLVPGVRMPRFVGGRWSARV